MHAKWLHLPPGEPAGRQLVPLCGLLFLPPRRAGGKCGVWMASLCGLLQVRCVDCFMHLHAPRRAGGTYGAVSGCFTCMAPGEPTVSAVCGLFHLRALRPGGKRPPASAPPGGRAAGAVALQPLLARPGDCGPPAPRPVVGRRACPAPGGGGTRHRRHGHRVARRVEGGRRGPPPRSCRDLRSAAARGGFTARSGLDAASAIAARATTMRAQGHKTGFGLWFWFGL